MTSVTKTFAQLTAAGEGAAFNCGDSSNHTFVVKVAAINTSVDYNFQMTLDNVNWADMNATNIQKTANGVYQHTFTGIQAMAVRPSFKAEVGGVAVTLDVSYKGGD
jgi:hypothetical protein